MSFGENLRKERVRLQLTQSQLGERCGLDHTHISQFERGRRDPSLHSLVAIRKGLKCAYEDLIDG